MQTQGRLRCLRQAIVLGALAMCLAGAAQAQMPAEPSGNPTPGTGSRQFPSGPHNSIGVESDPVAGSPFPDSGRFKRNEERQRRLVSDTQRLLALANQLKTEVASSGAETMTPEMLHQMDEIEKLARSVKDKMRE